MADRVIKPDSGNQLVLQDEGGSSALTVDTSGKVIVSNQLDISGATPIIQLTDTDTGADSLITASNGSGSVKIQCDNNGESADSTFVVDIDGSQKFKINADASQEYGGTDHGRMRIITGSYTNTIGLNVDITLESDIRNIECMAQSSVSSGGWMSGRFAIVSATTSNTSTSVNTIWSIGDSNTTGVAPTFSKTSATNFRVAFAASDGVGGTATTYYYVRVIMS